MANSSLEIAYIWVGTEGISFPCHNWNALPLQIDGFAFTLGERVESAASFGNWNRDLDPMLIWRERNSAPGKTFSQVVEEMFAFIDMTENVTDDRTGERIYNATHLRSWCETAHRTLMEKFKRLEAFWKGHTNSNDHNWDLAALESVLRRLEEKIRVYRQREWIPMEARVVKTGIADILWGLWKRARKK